MVKATVCRIVLSSISKYAITFTFRQIHLGKIVALSAMGKIVRLLLFSKNGFGFKQTTKVDMLYKINKHLIL